MNSTNGAGPTEAEAWLKERGMDLSRMIDSLFRMELDFQDYSKGAGVKGWQERVHAKVMRDVAELQVRDLFIHEFGFAILTRAAVNFIRPYGPLVEIGAGTGYWSYELAKAGIDIVATDRLPPGLGNNKWFKKQWCDVIAMDAVQAIKAYPRRTLLTCWPSLNELWATKTLKAFRGEFVLYEGEHRGATADDTFHDLLEQDFEIVNEFSVPIFYGLHDSLVAWRRK